MFRTVLSKSGNNFCKSSTDGPADDDGPVSTMSKSKHGTPSGVIRAVKNTIVPIEGNPEIGNEKLTAGSIVGRGIDQKGMKPSPGMNNQELTLPTESLL